MKEPKNIFEWLRAILKGIRTGDYLILEHKIERNGNTISFYLKFALVGEGAE